MSQSAYKKAGVDIDAGNDLVRRIKPAVKATERKGCMGGVGGFGAFFDPKAAGYDDPVLVSATDGVGTKLKVAIDTGRHDTVGQDLVAMCVNDLVVQGAEALFFLDYFACGKLDVEHAEAVVKGIAKGCELAGCALIGGETAEMPGMYGGGDYDLAGFAVGAVERSQIIDGRGVAEGQVLIGLPSSGIHSNGFSLVRKVLADAGLSYMDDLPFKPDFADDAVIADAIMRPTRIYSKALAALHKAHPAKIKAMAHITGGGLLENIPRVLPENLAVDMDASAWVLHNIFKWMTGAAGLSLQDMALTFNCGLGMVLFCEAADAPALMADLQNQGEYPVIVGRVTAQADLAQAEGEFDVFAPQIGVRGAQENWSGE